MRHVQAQHFYDPEDLNLQASRFYSGLQTHRDGCSSRELRSCDLGVHAIVGSGRTGVAEGINLQIEIPKRGLVVFPSITGNRFRCRAMAKWLTDALPAGVDFSWRWQELPTQGLHSHSESSNTVRLLCSKTYPLISIWCSSGESFRSPGGRRKFEKMLQKEV
jgi:hypothetical protein